jgi:uroporphyrinogen-III decarboxylase
MGPSISQSCIPSGEVGHNHTWLRLVDIRGYANVLYDMADGEPRLERLLEMLEQFNLGLLERWIERVGVEWMDFAEDLGMQLGPMLSPEHFRRYIKPSYRRLFARAQEAGCIVHVHADGDLRTLVDDLLECGADVLNLQDLVNGIDWIREHLKGRVCVELDIDRQKITFGGTPAEIDELIRGEVEALGSREGGLMLIYGLYPGIPLANAGAVMDAMERYSGYYS